LHGRKKNFISRPHHKSCKIILSAFKGPAFGRAFKCNRAGSF
jgi:hypothetical protein